MIQPVLGRSDVGTLQRAGLSERHSLSIRSAPEDRRTPLNTYTVVLVVVLVLVIRNGAVEDEDEKEDDDDWVAAPPRCAVSQVFNLPPGACEQRSADYKSATCLPADRYGRLKICATLNTCQPQVPLLAGLSIPKSRRPGEDVAVVGLNFDLLAGRDVFLATDD